MTVKELKKITGTATTMIIHIAVTKDDARDEKSSWLPRYTYPTMEEYFYDKLEVAYIYPLGKDELDVWAIYKD